jgi:hypothetical protein
MLKAVQNTKGYVVPYLLVALLVVSFVVLALPYSFKWSNQITEEEGKTSDFCCNTGDGDKCKPEEGPEKTLTYNGRQYGLIKSEVKVEDPYKQGGVTFYGMHLKDSGQRFNGNPIVLNTSYEWFQSPLVLQVNGQQGVCGKAVTGDVIGWLDNGGHKQCEILANEEMLYVCKENCQPMNPLPDYCGPYNTASPLSIRADCYGNKDSLYDVYLDLARKNNVPDVIKNCTKYYPELAQEIQQEKLKFIPPKNEDRLNPKSLQFNYFLFEEEENYKVAGKWLSPLCKPAIYLYPKEKSNINVKVIPEGKMTLTIPKYPQEGWDVTAYPSGQIDYENSHYPYLYYEAQISDEKILIPEKGYVVEYKNLKDLFSTLLPNLGLIPNEYNEFSSYWLKALPKSPWYFVGVVDPANLDTIAPLKINPSADSTIRVALYFKALENPYTVEPPQIDTPKRDGFTVVEWGGIFKRDGKHNFSCFM